MGMLADRYPDDRERGNAMALALGGMALGLLIGPPFGGIMYQFVGKASPFLILAMLALIDGLLQLLVLQPSVSKEETEAAPLKDLISDPYIILAAASITIANMGMGILEPSLPLYMMDTMHASKWEQGAAFLPASISYLIGTNIFGPLGHRIGRWLATMIGLIAISISLFSISSAKSLQQLILPNGVIGFAIGMVDSSIMPMLGYLVDIRHSSVYGGVYAIGDVAFCAGFILGPVLSSSIGKWLGFKWLVTITAAVCLLFSPSMLLLRKPPVRNEDQVSVILARVTYLDFFLKLLLHESTVRYVNYTNEETSEEESDSKKVPQQTMVP
ncbi:synaptic vesicular amine transporter-like protein [Dinothrombium tinctorium]|uniref:Synaptic vesicular amine transporter-like protein n=2 Tax=Dinothrombium tinctorium TaxID=1965070 RepID=A0A3S5WGQ4_9ACAR|nr:synaptic vesicular amine transporter-like protein [Dinothrombium tinctorium]